MQRRGTGNDPADTRGTRGETRHKPNTRPGGSSGLTATVFPAASIAAILAITNHSRAADLHVATTGKDTNPGTAGAPWRTIQKAATAATAGDTILIRAGIYQERVSLSNKSGTRAAPITFRKFPGDSGNVIISQTGVTPPDGLSSVFRLKNCSHIILRDLEIADYKTSGTDAKQRAQLPTGIYINGGGTGIQILSCKVRGIWQSSTTKNNYGANAFGIAVYGDAATPVDQLVIDGCQVYNLRTGASESVVLNGNVTNFRVTNNTVRDCNNIGIDFIGFEGANSNPALDQARNGVCSGNTVFRIDSKYNPVYGGNFTTGGGNAARSAPGLYVDGGRDILLERNHVYDCNFAISIGSENTGKVVSDVTVRNNIFHHCHVGGIVIGGSGTENGGVTRASFTNNTIYQNDTTSSGGGQFSIQNRASGITIRRNIMASTAAFAQFIVKGNTTGSIPSGSISHNLYKTAPGADFEFIWNNSAKTTFAAWQAAVGDTGSKWITGTLGLAAASPTAGSPATDFALTESSPAKDAGDNAAQPYTPAAGEKDYFGHSRVAGGRVDIGADEFLSALQSWRDNRFGLPDGGAGTGPNDDPDHDGVPNLVEWSQGMNPLAADSAPLPTSALTGANALRFTYRKDATGATHDVETSGDLANWLPATASEQQVSPGLFSRDFLPGAENRFIRLKVRFPGRW